MPGQPSQRAVAKLIKHQRITMRQPTVRLRSHQFVFQLFFLIGPILMCSVGLSGLLVFNHRWF
jgi:hypothetical protein